MKELPIGKQSTGNAGSELASFLSSFSSVSTPGWDATAVQDGSLPTDTSVKALLEFLAHPHDVYHQFSQYY